MARSNKQAAIFIARIREEGMTGLSEIYQEYRVEFLKFGYQFGTSEEDILDAYQDATIAFFENVSEGKIKELSSSVKTYIFGIGKYLLMHRFKNATRNISDSEMVLQLLDKDEDYALLFEKEELSHRQTLIFAALEKLPGRCKDLLLLFYYRNYSIEAIRNSMDYSNDNTVKANKSRCMKFLKEEFLKKKE
ncbi:MAG: RNA polymerase sigma factor (sigma-70 family) [Saprospiraceae bacterium]|jgi:RNA polymerase sigma factor (sigma-70 family)